MTCSDMGVEGEVSLKTEGTFHFKRIPSAKILCTQGQSGASLA